MILLFQLLVWNCNSWCFHASSMPFESAVVRLASRRSRPQSLLGAWARRPGGSGDTGFEVLAFRTSGYFRFKSKLEDSILKALNRLNLQSLTRLQEQVNAWSSWSLCSGPQGALGTKRASCRHLEFAFIRTQASHGPEQSWPDLKQKFLII